MEVFQLAFAVVSHHHWFCCLTVVFSYSPCVVYCGPEPTLGLIPLHVRLPEKLLWWNVRQEKGRWGQTEELFSLSLCLTLLTSVQNPHLAVIASKGEEIKEREESVFMNVHGSTCVHVDNCCMQPSDWLLLWMNLLKEYQRIISFATTETWKHVKVIF